MIVLVEGQETTMRWHSHNKEYYESRGYVYTHTGDEFTVKVEDLPEQSHAWVKVRCDFCGEVIDVKYQNYVNRGKGSDGYACTKCKHKKAIASVKNLYGVTNVFQLDEIIEKSKETSLMKYGETSYTKTAAYKESLAERMCAGFAANGTCPTSKVQIALRDMLAEIYGDCELNYPCQRCLLDCMVVVDDIKIDVEYDGTYWHRDEKKDRRRDEFVKSKGYKVLRISARRGLPDREDLINSIEYLTSTDSTFAEIIVDTK